MSSYCLIPALVEMKQHNEIEVQEYNVRQPMLAVDYTSFEIKDLVCSIQSSFIPFIYFLLKKIVPFL